MRYWATETVNLFVWQFQKVTRHRKIRKPADLGELSHILVVARKQPLCPEHRKFRGLGDESLGTQFQQMIPSRQKSILLNDWIKELRLHHDGPIPITLKKWEKVVAFAGE
jgi:hypothetical protein